MRPEDFSPGNKSTMLTWLDSGIIASMRPEDFSPGNRIRNGNVDSSHQGFNEAGGFLPRKLDVPMRAMLWLHHGASMRPEDFSPGNRSQ